MDLVGLLYLSRRSAKVWCLVHNEYEKGDRVDDDDDDDDDDGSSTFGIANVNKLEFNACTPKSLSLFKTNASECFLTLTSHKVKIEEHRPQNPEPIYEENRSTPTTFAILAFKVIMDDLNMHSIFQTNTLNLNQGYKLHIPQQSFSPFSSENSIV
jgi:hypothetical protein